MSRDKRLNRTQEVVSSILISSTTSVKPWVEFSLPIKNNVESSRNVSAIFQRVTKGRTAGFGRSEPNRAVP